MIESKGREGSQGGLDAYWLVVMKIDRDQLCKETGDRHGLFYT